MLRKHSTSLLVCLFKKSLHLCVHTLCSHLRVYPAGFSHRRLTEERILAIQLIGNHTRLLTHAPFGYHAARQLRCLFEIIFRTRCNLSKGYLFSRTTSKGNGQALQKVGTWIVAPIILRQELRHAEGPPPWHNRHLIERIDIGQNRRDQRMSPF